MTRAQRFAGLSMKRGGGKCDCATSAWQTIRLSKSRSAPMKGSIAEHRLQPVPGGQSRQQKRFDMTTACMTFCARRRVRGFRTYDRSETCKSNSLPRQGALHREDRELLDASRTGSEPLAGLSSRIKPFIVGKSVQPTRVRGLRWGNLPYTHPNNTPRGSETAKSELRPSGLGTAKLHGYQAVQADRLPGQTPNRVESAYHAVFGRVWNVVAELSEIPWEFCAPDNRASGQP